MTWTTLLDPDLTRSYMGSGELHSAWFMQKGWPGKGPCVALEIPECKLHVCLLQQRYCGVSPATAPAIRGKQ
jgi:hypothetical protein